MEEGWGGQTMQQAERGKRPSEERAHREDTGIIIMSAFWSQLLLQILLLLVSCRYINTKTPGPTPLPLSSDVRSVILKGDSHTERVELLNPVSLALECTWTGNQDKLPNVTGYWRKDGDVIENSHLTVQLENEQYNLKRVFSIVSDTNLGNYSCVFGNEAKIDFILAAPQIGEVRDKPIVSYVGDSVVITCKMEESKPKPSFWNWYKENGTDKEQIVPDEESHRYKIKNEEWKTKLVVNNLTKADSGMYYCGAVYGISTTMGHVELKVITFWEPLKPFLAILIEVVILVAIILLYEKSQSKKDCAAGNENADHINSPTEGENSEQEGNSTVRQRKL
ncbi:embigin [Mastacembelus armatus]|uniref:Embigin n=1 Tax=Mastacembelus armatus TaxID=205130 RepID=A0A3Q3RTU6_9TELE|nr:embigin [Mastacembelus armatus]XP_026176649.1 embigin [Mastacembelus armatus]